MAEETKQTNTPLLDEVSNTEITQSNISYIAVEKGFHTLPPGKIYHVFFSHCHEDREWVSEMVDKLESPEYGFKCCYADRDFDLGIPVFQNITKCIHSSKRTVIVMSPEFLQSPWCSYETRITLELDLDTRQRLLIPVMLRNCTVPDYIGRLTYMEVENEHFLERFVAAIAEDDSTISTVQAHIGSNAIMAVTPFQFNPHFHNTDEIVEVTVYQGCNFCSFSLTDFMPKELTRNGLQISPTEYRYIVTAVTGIFYVTCHGCYNKGLCAFPFVAALIATICLTGIYLGVNDPALLVFGIVALALFIFCVLLAIVHQICRLQASSSFSRVIADANVIAHTRNLMVTVKEYGWCSCTCDKMTFLTEQHRTTDGDEAWDLLVKHATEYCQLLLHRRSETPSEQRHTRQGECLCQFVESILVSGKTSCCDCIFGVRSRHPWRRYCLF